MQILTINELENVDDSFLSDNNALSRKLLQQTTSTRKTIDFVLVYKNSLNEESFSILERFIFNLELKGFELETAKFSINEEINFILIHAPINVLHYFVEIFDIPLNFSSSKYYIKENRWFKFMANELTEPNPSSQVYKRAKETLSETFPKTITNAEKGLIIYRVLSRIPFGSKKYQRGIANLIYDGVFETAFPLHDGSAEWTNEGPLNDRQLLAKYWSNLKCWYKEQPLDLIERYFGPEAAFYFAFLGFYNKMLVSASIAGIIFLILGVVSFHRSFVQKIEDICESELMLCPRCIEEDCKYIPVHDACPSAYFVYLLDNISVLTYAALLSIWSTIFFEMWKRKNAVLELRWNVNVGRTDCSMRPEYEERATHFKMSKITGMMEPYMPLKEVACRYIITSVIIIKLLLLVLLALFGVMLYVKTISTMLSKKYGEYNFTAPFTGSLISAAFIIFVDLFYDKIAFWLTVIENPRTQIEFDNSFTYKSYAIAFVNNYSVIFYIAFFKANFYTYPGDEAIWNKFGGLASDLCAPGGCIMDLAIQLFVILLTKSVIMTAKQYFLPKLKILLKKIRNQKIKNVDVASQWEFDFLLNETDKYRILKEYMQMIIQYGFVTFFVAAFPPAPLLALLNNLIELRVDAYNITRSYRRPVAFKVPNLVAWNVILRAVTYIGVATNAFVIGFTSDFVPRIIYRYSQSEYLHGYVTSILSGYNVSEFSVAYDNPENISICYYPGMRYPPNHQQKYQLTDYYWYILATKFIFVLLFEHIVILATKIISKFIPKIPFDLKEYINYQRGQMREQKLNKLKGTYLKDEDKRKTDIFKNV